MGIKENNLNGGASKASNPGKRPRVTGRASTDAYQLRAGPTSVKTAAEQKELAIGEGFGFNPNLPGSPTAPVAFPPSLKDVQELLLPAHGADESSRAVIGERRLLLVLTDVQGVTWIVQGNAGGLWPATFDPALAVGRPSPFAEGRTYVAEL